VSRYIYISEEYYGSEGVTNIVPVSTLLAYNIELELKTDLSDSLSWSMVASSNDGISPLILGTCWTKQKQIN
jgi:hypothetical protein